MKPTDELTVEQLAAENADLRARLARAEHLYRPMVETMNEAGLAVTPDGVVLFCNQRACDMLGRSQGQLLGQDLGALVVARDAEGFARLLRTAHAETVDTRIEFSWPEGGTVPMHVRAIHHEQHEGTVICLVGTDLSRVEADGSQIDRLQEQQRLLGNSREAALNLMQDSEEARRQSERAKAALQDSEQRLQQALQVSRSFTFEWHVATDRVLRSASCETILKVSGNEIFADTASRYFKCIHPGDRSRFKRILRRLTPANRTYTTQYRLRSGGGDEVVLEEAGQGEFDAEGHLERVIGVATDITDLKRAEQEQRRQREVLQGIFDTIPVLLVMWDAHLRRFAVNRHCEAVLGWTNEDANVGDFLSKVYPDAAYRAEVTAYMKSLEPGWRECHCTARDGQRVPIDWANVRLTDDSMIGIGVDLRQRRQAEQALRESEEKFRSAFANAAVGFAMTTPQGHFVDANPAYCAITGYDLDELRGMTFQQLVHPEDLSEKLARIERMMSGEIADFFIENRYVCKTGRVVWVQKSFSLVRSATGEPRWIILLAEDVTAVRQADEALRRLSQFPQENPHPVLRIGADETLMYANDPARAWLGSFGWRDGEPLPEPVRGLVADTRDTDYIVSTDITSPAGTVQWLSAVQPAGEDYINIYGTDITDRKHAEQELRRSREDLDRAQAVGQIGWWRLDLLRDVLKWSDENYRIFGIPKTVSLTYETFLQAVHPEDRAYVDARWQAGLRGEPYDIEHRIIVAGQIRWVREKAYLEFDDAGNVVGGFGITQDITDRRQAEEAMRESEQRLRLAAQAAEFGMYDADLEAGTLYWSPEMKAILGLPADAPTPPPATVPEFVHPDDRDRVRRMYEQAFDPAGTGEEMHEHRIVRPDGSVRWVQVRGLVEFTGQGGQRRPIRSRGMVLDITARRRAEEALRRLNETLEHRVAERTEQLQVLSDAAVAANDAEHVGEAAAYILQRASEFNGWAFARMYLPDPDDPDLLVPARVFYEDVPGRFQQLRAATREHRYRMGEGLLGRVYMSGEAEWTMDLDHDVEEGRAALSRELGLSCAAAFPVWAGHEVAGVLEFFADHPVEPTERMIETMTALGTQLGRVLERDRFHRHISSALLAQQRSIASLLHDSVSQQLVGTALCMERVAKQLEAQDRPEGASVRQLAQAVREAQRMARDTSRGLFPVRHEPGALRQALLDLAASIQDKYGVPCEFECHGSLDGLGSDETAHLYFIVSEAATNAARHAEASRIAICARRSAEVLTLEVRDDGKGMTGKAGYQSGAGLRIMRYRATLIGADLGASPAPAGGTLVRCTLELE